MADDKNTVLANLHTGLPNPTLQNIYCPPRSSRYGDVIHQSLFGAKMHPVADEGSVFIATNPTPGTGIAGKAAPNTLADTAALMHLRNSDATSGKNLYLLWLLLRPTAAGTNGTNFNLSQKIDKGANRYTSGGSAITPVNPNMGSTRSPLGVLKVGDLTIAAASSDARLVAHDQVRSVIKVIGDKYLLTFGDSVPPSLGMIMEGTAQAFIPVACPPVVLSPGDQWLLHEWAASQTVAASYEFVMCWAER